MNDPRIPQPVRTRRAAPTLTWLIALLCLPWPEPGLSQSRDAFYRQRKVAGERAARRGLSAALADLKEGANWADVGPRYRKILFGIGEGNSARAGLSRAAVEKVWRSGGKLSLAQLLRCRVRYFSDGLAVGDCSFIE